MANLQRWLWLPLLLTLPAVIFITPSLIWTVLIIPVLAVVRIVNTGRPFPRTPLNPSLLLLTTMLLVSIFITPDWQFSLDKLAGLAYGIAVYFATVDAIDTKRRLWWSVGLFCLFGLGMAAVGILGTPLETYTKFPILSQVARFIPTVSLLENTVNANMVGGILTWIIPVLLACAYAGRGVWRGVSIGGAVAAVLMLILSQSRGAMVGTAVSILALAPLTVLPRKWWRIWGIVVMISLLLGAFIIASNSDLLSNRLEIWTRAYLVLEDVPLTGTGMNIFRRIMLLLYPLFSTPPFQDMAHAHNEWAQVALDLGIPGLIAYSAILILTVWQLIHLPSPNPSQREGDWSPSLWGGLRGGLLGGLIAHSLYGLSDAIALGAKPGFMLWILFGICTAVHRLETRFTMEHTTSWIAEQWQKRPLIITTVVALILRLSNLWGKSLWLDEAHGLLVAQQGQAAFWSGAAGELYHPPLYYLLTQGWSLLGGAEWWLRLPGAIAGVICVPLVHWLGETLFGEGRGRYPALLIAFSPLLIWYAQDFRPYALIVLVGLIAAVATTKLLLNYRSVVWWIVLLLSCIALPYLHYFSILILLAQLFIWLILTVQGRTQFTSLFVILGGWSIALIPFIPWTRTVPWKAFNNLLTGTQSYPSQLIDQYLGIPMPPSSLLIAPFVGLILATLLAAWLGKRYNMDRHIPALLNHPVLQIGCACLLVGIIAAEAFPRALSIKRQLVILWPYLLLVIGATLNKWDWRRVAPVVVAAVAALYVIWFLPKDDWRSAVQLITAERQTGDVVVVAPGYMRWPLTYYGIDETEFVPSFPESATEFPQAAPQLEAALPTTERIWLIAHTRDSVGIPEVMPFLQEHGDPIATYPLYRITITLYETTK